MEDFSTCCAESLKKSVATNWAVTFSASNVDQRGQLQAAAVVGCFHQIDQHHTALQHAEHVRLVILRLSLAVEGGEVFAWQQFAADADLPAVPALDDCHASKMRRGV